MLGFVVVNTHEPTIPHDIVSSCLLTTSIKIKAKMSDMDLCIT